MPKRTSRLKSPLLELEITEEQLANARQSDSGGCLIADAIKRQYPHLSSVTVDMATVRVSDRDKGLRYIYLTPDPAKMVLLFFDQGWDNPHTHVTIKRAVQITPIKREKTGANSAAGIRASRVQRLEALEQLAASGEPMTGRQKSALTQLRKPLPPAPERPSSNGPQGVTVSAEHGVVVTGGHVPPTGRKNPNLLSGRARHYGAKTALPGEQWNRALEQAIAERTAAEG